MNWQLSCQKRVEITFRYLQFAVNLNPKDSIMLYGTGSSTVFIAAKFNYFGLCDVCKIFNKVEPPSVRQSYVSMRDHEFPSWFFLLSMHANRKY